jgi:GT2 family glycosyltransferase
MINPEVPVISVIIPTHNRSASLRRTLDTLALQDYPLHLIQVCVVADGCRDETVEMLQHYQSPFMLNVIEQSCQGAATARNQGAAAATAPLLLFLDDDIEATSGLVRAHVEAHQQPDQVVIGYLPPILNHQIGFFKIALRGWWEAMFQSMKRLGHRYRYNDLLSGNFSVSKQLFDHVGGFDPAFRCQEDYELGVRLLKAGALFTFAPDALGYHHENTDLQRSLWRKYQEGRANIQLGQKYPELISTLPLYSSKVHTSVIGRLLLALMFRQPALCDRVATQSQSILTLLESIRLRRHWRKLLDKFMRYWYLRGATDALRTQQALTAFLQNAPTATEAEMSDLELDLREGLAVVEHYLDQKRPRSIRLCYGQYPVATISSQPGAEALRAVHLRPTLATILALPLLRALILDGTVDPPVSPKQLLADLDKVLAEPNGPLLFAMSQRPLTHQLTHQLKSPSSC